MAPRSVLFVGLAAPLAVAAAIVPFRAEVANTNAALVLVVVVVGVAVGGRRPAGVAAALSAGLWFDVLLTEPYGQLTIHDPADVGTAVLLLIVGVAVAELAAWGHRQQAAASRADGYTAGIADAVASVTDAASPTVVLDQVRHQLVRLLQVESCRFDHARGVLGGSHPRLRADGEVEVNGALCDIERFGLPVSQEIEILLVVSGRYLGRFVARARPGARPSLAQRLVAVTLTERAAAVLAERRAPERSRTDAEID